MAHSGNQLRPRLKGDDPPRSSRLKIGTILLASAVFGAVAFSIARADLSGIKGFMPIRYVRVEGSLWNLDPDEFRRALAPLVATGYFRLDMAALEEAAKSFAWVDRVEVARVWPDQVCVRVVEHDAVARWGSDSLLNRSGGVFTPPKIAAFAQLPALSGPPGQEKQMLAALHMLNGKFQGRGLRVETLSLSKRHAWLARLSGGLEVDFGKQEPHAATDRLLSLLPQLGEERIATIRKLDLRYPNGFAVVFKPEAMVAREPVSVVVGQDRNVIDAMRKSL